MRAATAFVFLLLLSCGDDAKWELAFPEPVVIPTPDLSSLSKPGPSCGSWVVSRSNADGSLALLVQTRQGKPPAAGAVDTQTHPLTEDGPIQVKLWQGTHVTGSTCTDLPEADMEITRRWTATAGTATVVVTGPRSADMPNYGVKVTLEGVTLTHGETVLTLPTTTVNGGVGWYPG